MLNKKYRGKDCPTNIITFVFECPKEMNLPLIGDLVICRKIIESEAKKYNKNCEFHWAHIFIHGVLHLLGYIHDTENNAKIMENLEKKIMKKFGYPDPYND